ncbi:MAG: ankyrin repeat domain-containing protein [Bacteroidales bacterium]|nr:ankyrin repeat domain-containing protein [Bacteroidales bacterium]
MKHFFISLFLILNFVAFSQTLDNQLLDAAYKNDEKAVFDLLRRGADPNVKTTESVTPLMYAVQNGNYFIAKKLISSGAKVNEIPKNGVHPLINAVMNSDTGVVLLLLENGADPDAIDGFEMKSALMESVTQNNLFIFEALLKYGADPNNLVKDVSPLMQTIYLGVDTAFISILLKYGANPNMKNAKGYTPLMICVLYENIVATKLLLKNGAIPTTEKDSSFNTQRNVMDYSIKYKLDSFVVLFLPFFEKDLRFYHTKSILTDYPSGAKEIRKFAGKPFLTPLVSNVIISPAIMFNHKDVFGGFKIGFSEARFNIDMKFGIMPRFFRKAVLIEYNPNYFLQLWEKRTLLTAEINKNFYILSNTESSTGFAIGARAVYSFGDYSGVSMDITYPFVVSPKAEIWHKQNYFRMGIEYSYLPIQTQFPHYFGLNFEFFIPFFF